MSIQEITNKLSATRLSFYFRVGDLDLSRQLWSSLETSSTSLSRNLFIEHDYPRRLLEGHHTKMFDVVWTDPKVEHMGERMIRKEREAKEKGKGKARSTRQSISTNSTSSSSERAFGFFSKLKRKSSTPSRGKPCPSFASQEDKEVDGVRSSTCGVDAALSTQSEIEPLPQPSGASFPLHNQSKSEDEARLQFHRGKHTQKYRMIM